MPSPTPNDVTILAKTIYGEARGEYDHPQGGLSALIAIGNVVINRTLKGGWFGNTISATCLKPYQFSCWNLNDPNLEIIKHPENSRFNLCHNVAENVAYRKWPDLTQGSTHYHANECAPSWAPSLKFKIQIAHHLFYG